MTDLKPKTNFGKWLLHFCLSSGIEIPELVDKMGVDKTVVYRWLSSKKAFLPKSLNLISLNKALSMMTEIEEEEIYRQSSKAILKDS